MDYLHVDVQRRLMGIERQQERMRVKCSTRFFLAKRFGARQWSFLGPGSEKKWYSISEDSPHDNTRRKRTPSISSHELIVQRSAQKQRRWKIVDPLLCRLGNDYNCFSHRYFCKSAQSSRAVAEMCEEYRNVLLNDDDSAHKELLLQRYGERIEKLSQQDKLSKFCTDAGFLTTVEVGQYFMTKDTEEFSQFTESAACREYTLPRDEKSSDQNGWIRENTKIGAVVEVTTCCLQGKDGVEIRNKSVNRDNSHSWVRVSHGLNKLVTDLNNNEHETSAMQFEEYALRLTAGDLLKPIKGKRKTTKTIFYQLTHKNYTYWGKNLD